MKSMKYLWLPVIIVQIILGGVTYAQPTVLKESIPQNLPSEVQSFIVKCYSSDKSDRGSAVKGLGQLSDSLLANSKEYIIPFLISMLGDNVTYVESITEGNTTTSILLSPGYNASIVLEKWTSQKFGKDQTKWNEWWEGNKDSYKTIDPTISSIQDVTIKGIVFDYDLKMPVSNANVRLFLVKGEPDKDGWAQVEDTKITTTVDSFGSFVLIGVMPGSYMLMLERNGKYASARYENAKGVTIDATKAQMNDVGKVWVQFR